MDIAKLITDRIIAELENGVAPWVRPWDETISSAYNPLTGTVYRGMNQLWLSMHGMGRSSAWLTYKQASHAGMQVRRGAKGVPIIFWKPIETKRINAQGEDETCSIPMLKSYYVFNADDIDGASFTRPCGSLVGTVDSRVQSVVDKLCLLGGVNVADSAFYQATRDAIGMPALSSFRSLSDYHATLLHECVHATGHVKRLDRKLANRFGTEAYAFEELIAELGAAMLCSTLGLDGQLQHASYIASWLRVLRGDKTAIIKAASKAQAALDFLTVADAVDLPIAA